MLTRDTLPFFRAWLAAPLRVASVTPSSQALARLMTREIRAEHGPVMELGPGTGVFTHALQARGVAQKDLILVEFEAPFAMRLRREFPQASVWCMDACQLNRQTLVDEQKLGAVISGLPILSIPPKKVLMILHGAFRHLRHDGAFYQFTYGPRCPVSQRILDCLGLKAERVGGTLANFPPATVYRITRKH